MVKALPIGVSDFAKVREQDSYYVDKTMLIAEWLKAQTEVTLITRPRRFGKTLNMTMLREFFDITKDSEALFAGLAVQSTAYRQEMNQWPVIYLSFKDCKSHKQSSLLCIIDLLLQVVDALPKDMVLEESDAIRLKQIKQILLDQEIDKMAHLDRTIYLVSKWLYNYYHKKVIILIDEYDTPLISAYEQGYYDEVHFFFGSLYGSALKDNPYLERAMLTGIHRIAKENIFSGLNNLEVCTVLEREYSAYFGLTPEEAEALLTYYDLPLDEAVKAMYDGYRFGEQEIYNPWSMINYAKRRKLEAFWVNTAANDMLLQAVLAADKRTQDHLEQLLAAGQVMVTVDLQTSFFEMNKAATLWGLFMSSGYLTIAKTPAAEDLQMAVRIPNQEVMTSFRKIIERYAGFADNSLDELFGALQRMDMAAFRSAYEQIILTCTSFHDGASENAYHMLFLGMCVYLSGDYHIHSNLESGHGRADIVLAAKRPGKPNFVIEFKQGEAVDKLAQEALAQIHAKQYYAELTGETILIGIAHDLKHCQLASETIILKR